MLCRNCTELETRTSFENRWVLAQRRSSSIYASVTVKMDSRPRLFGCTATEAWDWIAKTLKPWSPVTPEGCEETVTLGRPGVPASRPPAPFVSRDQEQRADRVWIDGARTGVDWLGGTLVQTWFRDQRLTRDNDHRAATPRER